jgi:hypothetical protein
MHDIVTNALPLGGGVVVGGVITLVSSWVFYCRTAKDLEREAAKLRRQNTLMLRVMEEGGLAELNQDESGEFTGIIFKGGACLKGRASLRASGTVVEGQRSSVGAPDQSIGNQNG